MTPSRKPECSGGSPGLVAVGGAAGFRFAMRAPRHTSAKSVTDDFPTNETCSAGAPCPPGPGRRRVANFLVQLPAVCREKAAGPEPAGDHAVKSGRAAPMRSNARTPAMRALPFPSHIRASCVGALTSAGRCSDMISQEWEARGREALTCRLGSGSENRRRYRAR
jgi:hypothetical protein